MNSARSTAVEVSLGDSHRAPPKRRLRPILIRLIAWHTQVDRDFPWRNPECSPFHVLIAEVLLRRTRGETVLPVWNELVSRYPTPERLSVATESEVADLLRELGLHRIRAAALVSIARQVVADGGRLRLDRTYLRGLPHVGRYSVGALLAMSGMANSVAIDRNVVRVFNRVFGTEMPVEVHKADWLWDSLTQAADGLSSKAVNLALVDFGALVCTPRSPKCPQCPIRRSCDYAVRLKVTAPGSGDSG